MPPRLLFLRGACALGLIRDFPHVAIKVPQLPRKAITEFIRPSKVLGDLFDGYPTHGWEVNGLVDLTVGAGAKQAAAGCAEEGEVASFPIEGAETFFSLIVEMEGNEKREISYRDVCLCTPAIYEYIPEPGSLIPSSCLCPLA